MHDLPASLIFLAMALLPCTVAVFAMFGPRE